MRTFPFFMIVAAVLPPPPAGKSKPVPIIKLGKTGENVFAALHRVIEAMKELDAAKKTRNDCVEKVQEKQGFLDQVSAQHEQVKRKIALLFDDAEDYLTKMTAVKSGGSGRVSMSVTQASDKSYVEDMISTDTLQMESDSE